jgi:hypothetical protein
MKTATKKLDKEDIISRMQASLGLSDDYSGSGFIYPDGQFTALYAGTTHDDQCYTAGVDELEYALQAGIVRINIKGEQLAVEHNFSLTRQQQKCIIRIIRANKFYSLIYFQLDKKETIELNEWNGIKQYHLEKIWNE